MEARTVFSVLSTKIKSAKSGHTKENISCTTEIVYGCIFFVGFVFIFVFNVFSNYVLLFFVCLCVKLKSEILANHCTQSNAHKYDSTRNNIYVRLTHKLVQSKVLISYDSVIRLVDAIPFIVIGLILALFVIISDATFCRLFCISLR